jgi:DNA-binding MarR family transcriptional regulator
LKITENIKKRKMDSSLAPGESPLESVITETVSLFYRLRVVAEQIHHQGETSGPKRGILKTLDRLGPQTVPRMARTRPVSRQYIQTLINQLAKGDFVEFVENPAHRRSPLVSLTPKGKEFLDAMAQREIELLEQLKMDSSEKELKHTADVLRKVRELFESRQWEQLLKKTH